VLVMDCTYRTKRFKMPLLNVVSVTSCNTTFFSCFAFLSQETEINYSWALRCIGRLFDGIDPPRVIVTDRELALMNAIKVVFPQTSNLLCIWHINKNLVANCKQLFADNTSWDGFLNHWNLLIAAPTENDYDSRWRAMQRAFVSNDRALAYIESVWLPHRKAFISAWADRYLHLGNKATSRGEGAHAILKGYLQSSTGDLYMVHQKISLAVDNQYKEINTQLASERTRIPHELRHELLHGLPGNVSVFALRKIREQIDKAARDSPEKPLPPCTGSFRDTMGLPCAHTIKDRFITRNNPPSAVTMF
jgi:hypothetical protein